MCLLTGRDLFRDAIFTSKFLVKFLSEGELDASARLAGPAAEAAQSEEMVSNLGSKI